MFGDSRGRLGQNSAVGGTGASSGEGAHQFRHFDDILNLCLDP